MSEINNTEKSKRIEFARQRLYKFENVNSIFDDVSPFWFMGRSVEKDLTKTSTYKVFSDFILSYLACATQVIHKKQRKNITSVDLLDNDKVKRFREDVFSDLDTDMIGWMQNECLPVLTELMKRLNIDSFQELAKLTNLLQSEVKFIQASFEVDSPDKAVIYDVFYKIVSRIQSYGFLSLLDRTLITSKKRFKISEETIQHSVGYFREEITSEGESFLRIAVLFEERRIRSAQVLNLPIHSGGENV